VAPQWRSPVARLCSRLCAAHANQLLASWLGIAHEAVGYTYLLRVVGFLLILGAIIDKNRVKR